MNHVEDRFFEKLREQLDFLKTSCDAFDSGRESESIRIATSLRVLLHDTRNSISLLRHIRRGDTKMLSSARGLKDAKDFIAFEICLASPTPVRAKPLMNSDFLREVPLSQWLDGECVFNHKGRPHARRKIILSAANKDGGAHVDSSLEAYYESLSRGEMFPIITGSLTCDGPPPFPQGVRQYVRNGHLALLRQFAFETIASSQRFGWDK